MTNADGAASRARLTGLPRMDALIDACPGLIERYGRPSVVAALRAAVDDARRALLGGDDAAATAGAIVASATDDLRRRRPGPPVRVINAAGVVVHTNVGRAPLSAHAVAAMTQAAGYTDVELDLATGERGSRMARLSTLLTDATGADDGLATNNGAAALVLALAALARGREVLVSRGELVEIGGSFRLPDIMAAAGVELVEVGTTNKTRAADYEAAGDVALILKVHPSNFRVEGFSQAPSVRELAMVARRLGVPLLHDVGSGLLEDAPEPWLTDEPSVRASLESGADLVVCSGDKLLGGPQAGLLVGRADLVAACARHPLARALRLDKLRIAALVATLEAHVRGAPDTLPVWQALHADSDTLHERAAVLAAVVGGDVVEGATLVGGGAAPGARIPTPVVRITTPDATGAAAALRAADPPILVRISDGALLIDLRTVGESDDAVLAERLRSALSA